MSTVPIETEYAQNTGRALRSPNAKPKPIPVCRLTSSEIDTRPRLIKALHDLWEMNPEASREIAREVGA